MELTTVHIALITSIVTFTLMSLYKNKTKWENYCKISNHTYALKIAILIGIITYAGLNMNTISSEKNPKLLNESFNSNAE